MNISALNNVTTTNKCNALPLKTGNGIPYFGIRMSGALTKDTVSFGAAAPTAKKMVKRSDGISIAVARKIRNSLAESHEYFYKMLCETFSDVLSRKEEIKILTLIPRLKSENSICEKTATRSWVSKEEILDKMADISGVAFVLETPQSLAEFIPRFSELLKSGELRVEEVEYHRLAPKIKNNKIEKTYDSLNIGLLSRLKKAIIDIQNPSTQFWREVDSMSGYSGLHFTVVDKKGCKHEIQVMTRSIAELKQVENLYYKARNGKSIDPKYKFIEGFLKKLRPQDPNNMTPQEVSMHKAITKYTQDAYVQQLKKPYEWHNPTRNPFLKPSAAIIADYDFNNVKELKDNCDRIAQRTINRY